MIILTCPLILNSFFNFLTIVNIFSNELLSRSLIFSNISSISDDDCAYLKFKYISSILFISLSVSENSEAFFNLSLASSISTTEFIYIIASALRLINMLLIR